MHLVGCRPDISTQYQSARTKRALLWCLIHPSIYLEVTVCSVRTGDHMHLAPFSSSLIELLGVMLLYINP